ncbi:hypothetical protein SLS58_000132 [Diplodia intermedia]|uniref:Uncharacterized protein n=1 Tax=Diplodia intermedia TaxID=856260 RepID=A0ABR3U5J9_9PEZI
MPIITPRKKREQTASRGHASFPLLASRLWGHEDEVRTSVAANQVEGGVHINPIKARVARRRGKS